MTTATPRPSRASGARRLTPVVPWPAAGTLDEHIRTEQVRLVFQQAPQAQLLSVVAAAMVAWVLYDVGDRTAIRWWFATIVLVTVGRVVLGTAFRKAAPLPQVMRRWESAFLVTLALVSLTWGVGGWLIMPAGSPLHQAVVYFFLMGIAAGAAASYAAHAAGAAIAITAIIVPSIVAFLVTGPGEQRALAVGGMLYLAAAIRSIRSYGFYLRKTFQLSYELHTAYAHAQALARTDELTGLANRRAFVERGRSAVEQARRYGRPLSLVTFDVDHFKKINDTYGHAAGDEVLRQVAALATIAQRGSDVAGRLGGEEFAVLLPETTAAEATVFAERLREAMTELRVAHEGAEIRFTCSFGVAEVEETTAKLDELLGAADEALYRAKAAGRNRVSRA